MAIAERAIRAFREQRDRPWTRSMEWDRQYLKAALKETLGLEVEPTSNEIELEGLIFSAQGAKLLHVRGPDGLDYPILSWEDLGRILDGPGNQQDS